MPGSLPDGVAERLHFIEARDETNLLWTVEEALRSRPVSVVIAASEKPMSLTAGRRLQLAAEAGGTTGLMLIDLLARSAAQEVRLYGFDFFASLSLSGRRTADQVPHDFDAEAAWADALIHADPRLHLNRD